MSVNPFYKSTNYLDFLSNSSFDNFDVYYKAVYCSNQSFYYLSYSPFNLNISASYLTIWSAAVYALESN